MTKPSLAAAFAALCLFMPASALPAHGQIAQARSVGDTVTVPASARRGEMGGGFIEYLYNGGQPPAGPIPTARRVAPAEPRRAPAYGSAVPVAPGIEPVRPLHAYAPDQSEPPRRVATPRPGIDPRFLPQTVSYQTSHRPGTVVIDTRERYLYLVEAGGTARRYGVGIGRPGFGWTGTKTISRKQEWPDWRPPEQMLRRRPDLPRFMAGGPANPLGARAMYLGSSLYRIHGSNEPWTIGQAVSSGCFRMRNEDVIDLYSRVRVGTRVVVM
jgi:lipoprotein-anchoring transpeptidase ErfK/SrfK